MIFPFETIEQKEIIDFYGQPGEHQVLIDLPFPMKLSWADKSINRFYCHEKVRDSLIKVYKGILLEYGYPKIQDLGLNIWGGCFNVRKKRGGNNFSLHSWGIAIDTDPGNNKLRWSREKARLAKPEYVPYWEIWEKEGWISLGRVQDFDWMHVQAARR